MDTNKDKDFSKIYHLLVDTGILAKMSRQDIKIYLVLNRFANYKTGIAYPSVKTLSKLSGINKNDIRQTVDRLCSMGLIEATRAGERFSFRKTYRIVKKDSINPDLALSIIPTKTEKCRYINRGKDGKFRPLPQNEELAITPKNAEDRNPKNSENNIPQKGEKAIPLNKEKAIVPDTEEKKESNRETNNRDRGIDIESKTLPEEKQTVCKKVDHDTLCAIFAFARKKGISKTTGHFVNQGYSKEKIQELLEFLAIKENIYP